MISLYNLYITTIGVSNASNELMFYLQENSLSKGSIINKTKQKLNFYHQIGGIRKTSNLKSGSFEFHISEIVPLGNEQSMINFLIIDEVNDNCAMIIYDNKGYGTNMVIQGIINDSQCIKCLTPGVEYKTGDILMQIILKYVYYKEQYNHIKTISLTDNSGIRYRDRQLQLMYLRTLMYGTTYYAKYGFKPVDNFDKLVYRYNKNIFLDKPVVTEIYLNELSKKYLDDNKTKILNEIVKTQMIIVKKIYVNKLIFSLVSKFKICQNALKNDNVTLIEKNELNKKTQDIFDLIRTIYKKIYEHVGYKFYKYNEWILNVERI